MRAFERYFLSLDITFLIIFFLIFLTILIKIILIRNTPSRKIRRTINSTLEPNPKNSVSLVDKDSQLWGRGFEPRLCTNLIFLLCGQLTSDFLVKVNILLLHRNWDVLYTKIDDEYQRLITFKKFSFTQILLDIALMKHYQFLHV